MITRPNRPMLIGIVLAATLFGTSASLRAEPTPALTGHLHLGAMTAAIDRGDYRRIEGVLVTRSGETLFEDYFGRSDAATQIDARSAGKSITALAVGMAIDDGKLAGVDAPAFAFFNDRKPFANDGLAKQDIRIGDLLTMSSALACDDWKPESAGNEERMYAKRDWTRFALDIPIDPAFARGPNHQGRYAYCTAGTFLLGRIVERATGERFDAYVQRRLFDPLGIHDAVWRHSPTGEVQTGGQLSLAVRDFAAIGRLVMQGGQWNGRQLVSKHWLQHMLTPRARATPVDAYGYLWWIRDFRIEGESRPYPGFYMSGNGGNKVILLPDLKAVIVILATDYNGKRMHEQTVELVERHILPALVKASLP